MLNIQGTHFSIKNNISVSIYFSGTVDAATWGGGGGGGGSSVCDCDDDVDDSDSDSSVYGGVQHGRVGGDAQCAQNHKYWNKLNILAENYGLIVVEG